MKTLPVLTMSLGLLGMVSCTSHQQQGALVGGLVGAGAGALFGDDHQDVIAGAAVGAGVGAAGAAIHEDSMRRTDTRRYETAPPLSQNPPPRRTAPSQPAPRQSAPAPAPRSKDYPTAQRTTTPGEVLSPYPPYNRIDVSGYRSGQLVKDPKTGEIFRVP